MLYSAQLRASLRPSSPNLEQEFSLLHILFHLMHDPVLGAGQENTQSCDWEKLQREGALESCRLSMVVPVNPLFLRANATCSTNWLCLSHSTLFSKFLTLSHSVWDFSLHITFCFYFPFLIQHINVHRKECIGLYAWTDSP